MIKDKLNNLDTIKKLFKQKKIIPTNQRLEMASFLLEKNQHLNAEDILSLINKQFPKVSRATIYNNLHLFVETGLLNKHVFDHNLIIYDSNTSEHYHIRNKTTNEIIDIEIDNKIKNILIEHAKETMKKKYKKNYDITNLEIIFDAS